MRIIRFLPILLLLASIPLAARHAPEEAEQARLRAALDRELGAPRFRRGMTAAVLLRLDNGAVLYERNADLLFRPASNAKLFTTFAALRNLDSAEAFSTLLFARPASSGSGRELYLRGGGDPLFGVKDIQKLVENISARGIREVASLALDASLFDTLRSAPGWMIDDEQEAFQPFLSSFPIERDRVSVAAHARGGRVTVVVTPAWEEFHCAADASIGPKDSLRFSKAPRSNDFRVSGTLRAGRSDSSEMSMWDPPRVLHARMLAALADAGIRIGNRECRFARGPPEAEPVGAVRRSLDEVLGWMNPESDNLSAESLLKALAQRRTGRPGSTEEGIGILREDLQAAEVDTAAVLLVDGSGISFYNLCSARSMAQTLAAAWRSEFRGRYVRSLAVPGKAGTLRRRMDEIEGKEFLHAKTGTLRGVSNLSGFALPPGGVPVCFAIFMQNLPLGAAACRSAQDAAAGAILRYCRSAARSAGAGATRSR